ncbi:MAG TPA: adenylate/guanylate cyclase domain-containing protein [Acidimicrobiales bacterium]|nr:adenylate/guanylate cyclase domain-containing protein [Acidimicrobiales bacterium]
MTEPADDFQRAIVERIVGEARYTAEEIAAASGYGIDECERLWTELGFPPVDPSVRHFTDADLAALRTLHDTQSSGLVDTQTAQGGARVLGQALSRVAMAQAQNMAAYAAEIPDDPAVLEAVGPVLDATLERLDSFLLYVWRRHLAAALQRLSDARPTEVVGFVDMVGYTRLTAGHGEDELADLVAGFQVVANSHITAAGGRVLKVIGDAVMFVVPEPEPAARAAVGISRAARDAEALPDVRVGLASGPVVEVEGDLYGETVNRASRLAELAYPGTVVVDDPIANALFESELHVRAMRPRKLKGLGFVSSWVVRAPRAWSDLVEGAGATTGPAG